MAQVPLARSCPELFRVTGPLLSLVLRTEDVWQRYNQYTKVCWTLNQGFPFSKKSVIGAHNRCWKYLIGAISIHGEANRSLEILGGDKDRQLHTLWKETNIGKILPWDDIEEEAEKLLASRGELQTATRLTNNEMMN